MIQCKTASGCGESLETETCMHVSIICTHTFVNAVYICMPPIESNNAFYCFSVFSYFSSLCECWFCVKFCVASLAQPASDADDRILHLIFFFLSETFQ